VAARGGSTARPATVRDGSIETATLDVRDVVLLSWHMYSYVPGRSARVSLLARPGRHFAPGGRLLLSYVPGPPDADRRGRRVTTLVTQLARVDWRPEPGDCVFTAGDSVHFEHRFTVPDIEAEAAMQDSRSRSTRSVRSGGSSSSLADRVRA
jgi:hypothetical protein